MTRSENPVRTLQQVAQRIEALSANAEKSNVAAATALLAGLVLDKAIIRQILREEIVKDSVIYQDILQRGLQQGLQQGLEAGRQQGLEAGRQQGLEAGRQREITLVLRLLTHRFSSLEPATETRIRLLTAEQLEALGEALLDFQQLEELITWLEHNP